MGGVIIPYQMRKIEHSEHAREAVEVAWKVNVKVVRPNPRDTAHFFAYLTGSSIHVTGHKNVNVASRVGGRTQYSKLLTSTLPRKTNMSTGNSRRREVALPLAKRFDKFIPLPHLSHWKVHVEDVLHRGTVVCYMRTKSPFFLLPDAVSVMKSRHVTVTRMGYMVIYETDERGLIVDLRTAFNVFCSTDKALRRGAEFTHCHIKIRLPRGNIHMFVSDDEIHKWTCSIMRVTSSRLITQSQRVAEAELMTAMEDAMEERVEVKPVIKLEDVVPEIDFEEFLDVTQEDGIDEEPDYDLDVTQELEPCSPPSSPIITVVEMKRPSNVSVRSLREKLEKSLTIRSKEEVLAEQKRQCSERALKNPLFVEESFSEIEVTAEEKRMEQKPKEWWMRSLRC